MQTGCSQDQVSLRWDLILATACMHLKLYFLNKYSQKLTFFQNLKFEGSHFVSQHTIGKGAV